MIELYSMEREEMDKLSVGCTYFNLHYNQTKKYQDVYDTLLTTTTSKNRKELWCVITNIARALKHKAIRLSIPKNCAVYGGNKQEISRRRMFALLDVLCNEGYLIFYKGGFINVKKQKYVQSMYEITQKMRNLWEGIDISGETSYYTEVIEVKDRETKEMKTSNIHGVKETREMLLKYNKALCNIDLSLDGVPIPPQQYKRVFTDSTEFGGRIYNVVGGVQTMKQEERKRLKINGECVVELDFKALHPSILYDKLYQQVPEIVEHWIENAWSGKYDPYYDGGADCYLSIDKVAIEDFKVKHNKPSYNPIRNLIKFAVMTSLNAKRGETRATIPAAKSLSSEWYDDKKRPENERKYFGLSPLEKNKKGEYTFPCTALCELVQAANTPIEKYFFSDVGIKLQRIDSDIIGYVIQKLAEKGEILYPEHDSVIVRESLEDEVIVLMKEAYRAIVGSDKFCFVERK